MGGRAEEQLPSVPALTPMATLEGPRQQHEPRGHGAQTRAREEPQAHSPLSVTPRARPAWLSVSLTQAHSEGTVPVFRTPFKFQDLPVQYLTKNTLFLWRSRQRFVSVGSAPLSFPSPHEASFPHGAAPQS